MTELKSCPFCGSNEIDAEGWASLDAKGPACDNCSASAETVELWNQRPQLDELRAALVEARDVIRADRNWLFECCTVGPEHDPATLEDGAASDVADYDETLAKIDKALGNTNA